MDIHILLERLSDILFHFTSPQATLSILRDDQFKLTTSFGTASDKMDSKKLYYLSTTRTLTGKFHAGVRNNAVMLNLDGTKLNQRYSGGAVDYWGREFRKIDPRSESEDRLFSADPVIPNATNYIQEIHVLYQNSGKPSKQHKIIRQLIILSKQKNIPIFIYDDESAWKLQNKNKTAKFKDMKIDSEYDATYPRRNWLAPYIELIKKKDKKELSSIAVRHLDSAMRHEHDFISELNNDIHNSRTTDREKVSKLVNMFKQLGIKSATDFHSYVVDKWK